jgi:ribosomal protein L11 methyltransferase
MQVNTYIEYRFDAADNLTAEILLALLADMGFSTFDLQDALLFAYIASAEAAKNPVENEIQNLQKQYTFTYTSRFYEDTNWNAEWEKNFEPVIVEEQVLIRAPFHRPQESIPYEIIIEPKMSFGTGHHASTYLMLQAMLTLQFENKTVCDAGCGTGILSIFASKLGATQVTAIDNNEWAYENTLANVSLNQTGKHLHVLLGDLACMEGMLYDVILANINKPILLENYNLFHTCLIQGGQLLISGILQENLPEMLDVAAMQGFTHVASYTRDSWACALFTVNSVENF